RLPFASFAVTVIVAEPLPAVIDAGAAATSDWLALGAAAVTVTPAVCVIAIPLIVAEIVFASATVELTVPVATPLASVPAAGCVSVLPLPVAASTTGMRSDGRRVASFAVTVIVAEPFPAVIDAGAAATSDWLALGAAAGTVTPAVCVMAIPLIVAEIVFASATVELNVPVATPLTSVTTAGCVSVFPLPVAASTTGM